MPPSACALVSNVTDAKTSIVTEKREMSEKIPIENRAVSLKFLRQYRSITGHITGETKAFVHGEGNSIVKLTEDHKLSFAEVALLKSDSEWNRKVFGSNYKEGDERLCFGKATYFVSHAWSLPFETLLESLENFEADNKSLDDKVETFYWLDLFAVNQHGCSSDGNLKQIVQEELDNMPRVVAAATKGLLLVCSPLTKPVVFSRGWCWNEVAAALESNKQINLALCKESLGKLDEIVTSAIGGVQILHSEIFNNLSKLDAETSKCEKEEDRQRIHEKLKALGEGGGFAVANRQMKEAQAKIFFNEVTKRKATVYTSNLSPLLKKLVDCLGEGESIAKQRLQIELAVQYKAAGLREGCIQIVSDSVKVLEDMWKKDDSSTDVLLTLCKALIVLGSLKGSNWNDRDLEDAKRALSKANEILSKLSHSKMDQMQIKILKLECLYQMSRISASTIMDYREEKLGFKTGADKESNDSVLREAVKHAREAIKIGDELKTVDTLLKVDPELYGGPRAMLGKAHDHLDTLNLYTIQDERLDCEQVTKLFDDCIKEFSDGDQRKEFFKLSKVWHLISRRSFKKALGVFESNKLFDKMKDSVRKYGVSPNKVVSLGSYLEKIFDGLEPHRDEDDVDKELELQEKLLKFVEDNQNMKEMGGKEKVFDHNHAVLKKWISRTADKLGGSSQKSKELLERAKVALHTSEPHHQDIK